MFTKEIANFRFPPTADFSADNRWLIVKMSGDSLLQLDLRLRKETIFPFCRSYKIPSKGNGEWLAYELTNSKLFLQNMISGKTIHFSGVRNYLFGPSGQSFVVETELMEDSLKPHTLQCVNLVTLTTLTIWRGKKKKKKKKKKPILNYFR